MAVIRELAVSTSHDDSTEWRCLSSYFWVYCNFRLHSSQAGMLEHYLHLAYCELVYELQYLYH